MQSDDVIESVARAIHGEKMKGHNPECLYQHNEGEDWPVDRRDEYADPFTGKPRALVSHFAWRHYEKAARAAIAAHDTALKAQVETLREALDAAKYLIENLDAVTRGVCVRDLDESWERYGNRRAALAATEPKP